jgi:hypothetical protein
MTMAIDSSPEAKARLEAETVKNGQVPDNRDVAATDWDALTALIDSCQMDTGITDLAHQHDHYLYGTPKRVD